MAKKRLGYVELEWTCPHCGTNNPGPRAFCSACGAPQGEQVEFHQAPNAELLTDEDAIKRAQAGPDVQCPYCNARNPGGAKFCGACGAELGDAESRPSGEVLGAYRTQHKLEITCPACGTLNKASDRDCRGCGAPLPRREEEPASPGAPVRKGRAPTGFIIAGAVACVALAAVAIALLTRTKPVTGSVRSVEWSRSIAVEAMQPIERKDWRDQIPSGAEILSCEQELRDTSDEPAPGALEVCGTPYTIDTGSGYGEVVQDCVYEVYDDYCTYSELDWAVVDHVTASGDNLDPYWPTLTVASDQREGQREETFLVLFSTEDGGRRYSPDSEASFKQFSPGSTWTLEINALGTVVKVSPAP